MGVFYITRPTGDTEAGSPTQSQISWLRLAFATLLLAVILGAAIWTAEPENDPAKQYEALHAGLVAGFQVLLGLVVGLVTGETVSQK